MYEFCFLEEQIAIISHKGVSVLSGFDYEPPKQEPPYEDDEETWDTVRRDVEEVKSLVFPELGI